MFSLFIIFILYKKKTFLGACTYSYIRTKVYDGTEQNSLKFVFVVHANSQKFWSSNRGIIIYKLSFLNAYLQMIIVANTQIRIYNEILIPFPAAIV